MKLTATVRKGVTSPLQRRAEIPCIARSVIVLEFLIGMQPSRSPEQHPGFGISLQQNLLPPTSVFQKSLGGQNTMSRKILFQKSLKKGVGISIPIVQCHCTIVELFRFQEITHLFQRLSLVEQCICIVGVDPEGAVIGSDCLIVPPLAVTKVSIFNTIVFPLQFAQQHVFSPSSLFCD